MRRSDQLILTRELRNIYKSVEDLGRRLAMSHMTGRVAEIDGDRIRLELLPVGASGKRFLSPWVQVQEMAGATGSHFPVKVGDPMRLMSPQGELGPQSIAVRDGYTSDAPTPAPDQELALAHDGCAIRIKGGVIRLEGPVEVEGTVDIEGARLTHNGKNVGHDHRHTDVMPGPALTGPPA